MTPLVHTNDLTPQDIPTPSTQEIDVDFGALAFSEDGTKKMKEGYDPNVIDDLDEFREKPEMDEEKDKHICSVQ